MPKFRPTLRLAIKQLEIEKGSKPGKLCGDIRDIESDKEVHTLMLFRLQYMQKVCLFKVFNGLIAIPGQVND